MAAGPAAGGPAAGGPAAAPLPPHPGPPGIIVGYGETAIPVRRRGGADDAVAVRHIELEDEDDVGAAAVRRPRLPPRPPASTPPHLSYSAYLPVLFHLGGLLWFLR